jgi:hypothetical protein
MTDEIMSQARNVQSRHFALPEYSPAPKVQLEVPFGLVCMI